jgi:hypothetical protein
MVWGAGPKHLAGLWPAQEVQNAAEPQLFCCHGEIKPHQLEDYSVTEK